LYPDRWRGREFSEPPAESAVYPSPDKEKKMDGMREQFDEMMGLYQAIKRKIRQLDPHLYERWKAGGFIVDKDIVSMYPDLGSVVEDLEAEEYPADERELEGYARRAARDGSDFLDHDHSMNG
jgi:hypothetical protein